MRELKFRAWYHKGTYCKEPKMYWFDLMWGNTSQQGSGWIGMLPIGETRKYRMMSDNRKQIDPYDCEIMQYTGLQDKNGVDIYEGDILRCYSKYYGIFDAKVSFMNGSFGIANYSAKQIENPKGWKHEHPCVDSRGFLLKEISDFKGGYSNISLDDDVEVIGNIYENPELL